MTNPWSWPALRGVSSNLPSALEHGVWGKVHGAASDFRWIARSPGLFEGLQRELALGAEDAPHDGVAWRVLARHAVAVHFYPSRARDASGRSGGLEKYVVLWPLDTACSPVVGALLLLPLVAAQSDGLWWQRATDQPWSERHFSLPLERLDLAAWLGAVGSTSETVTRTLHERLAAHQRQGLAELRDAGPDWLARLYTALLGATRPVCLTPPRRTPLPPAALAGLLLPLPHEMAARLSLCSWLPVERPSGAALEGRFDLLLGAFPAAQETPASGVPDHLRAGRDLAAALLAAPVETRATSPTTAPDPWQRPCDLPLTPPRPDASVVVKLAHAFVRNPARRWLSVADLSRELVTLPAADTCQAALLPHWVDELHRCLPVVDPADSAARDEHWRVKRDVLRALTLLAFPSLARRMGAFESGRVPPLLFVNAVTRPRDLLDSLDEALLTEAVRRSLNCPASPARREVEQRLREWSHDNPLVARLVSAATMP